MVGWLPTAELSFVCPDHREQPSVSLGSGEGSQKLLISPAANSCPPELKGTPSPADTRKPAGAAELVRWPPPPRSPAVSALSCTLRKPQLPREKLLHGEGKAGSTQPQGVLEGPLRASGWLYICTPGSPQPSVAMAVTEICSGLRSDNIF